MSNAMHEWMHIRSRSKSGISYGHFSVFHGRPAVQKGGKSLPKKTRKNLFADRVGSTFAESPSKSPLTGPASWDIRRNKIFLASSLLTQRPYFQNMSLTDRAYASFNLF